MKKIIFLLLLSFSFITVKSQTLETFHDFMGFGILGDTINFSDYSGKKVLVVNTASYCAYTPQFTDLAALDSIYSGPGFAIIGFPCNDFGGQDPGDDSTINNFCTGIYGVQFQMMSKVSITAPDTAEVYKWLQLQARNGVADAPVTWNFNKFCIDELGRWVHHFPSTTNPLDTAIANWINSPAAVGIQTHEIQNEILLVENPVKDKITIQVNVKSSDKINIKLYDTKGVLVSNIYNGEISNSKTISYPVNNIKAGIYFIEINGINIYKSLKLVLTD